MHRLLFMTNIKCDFSPLTVIRNEKLICTTNLSNLFWFILSKIWIFEYFCSNILWFKILKIGPILLRKEMQKFPRNWYKSSSEIRESANDIWFLLFWTVKNVPKHFKFCLNNHKRNIYFYYLRARKRGKLGICCNSYKKAECRVTLTFHFVRRYSSTTLDLSKRIFKCFGHSCGGKKPMI